MVNESTALAEIPGLKHGQMSGFLGAQVPETLEEAYDLRQYKAAISKARLEKAAEMAFMDTDDIQSQSPRKTSEGIPGIICVHM